MRPVFIEASENEMKSQASWHGQGTLEQTSSNLFLRAPPIRRKQINRQCCGTSALGRNPTSAISKQLQARDLPPWGMSSLIHSVKGMTQTLQGG